MTVLNTIELTKTSPFVPIVFFGLFALTILSLFIGIRYAGSNSKKLETVSAISAIIFLISFFSLWVFGAVKDSFREPTGEYQYEVTFADEMSFTEVMDKYNVIEQRGDIFVLEEKEELRDD